MIAIAATAVTKSIPKSINPNKLIKNIADVTIHTPAIGLNLNMNEATKIIKKPNNTPNNPAILAKLLIENNNVLTATSFPERVIKPVAI